MLCPLTFRSLAATMTQMKGFSIARDYRVVTVSNRPGRDPGDRPREGERDARADSGRWGIERPVAVPVRQRRIDSPADRERRIPLRESRPGVRPPGRDDRPFPGGTVSRYLYGVEIDPRT